MSLIYLCFSLFVCMYAPEYQEGGQEGGGGVEYEYDDEQEEY